MSDPPKKGSRSITIEEEKGEVKTTGCVDTVGRFFPIVEWLPKYTRFDGVSDLIAGVTLGLTMIPQSIAYAALAGLTAQYGLYSALGGSLIYIFFGTIKQVSIGPTSLMALLTIEFTRHMPPEFVILLCFLKGCIELLMGLLNLGFLVDFISMPVTSGFTSASSAIIIIAQLQGLLGLKYATSSNIDSLVKVFQHIGSIKIADTVVGVSGIIFLLCLRRINSVNLCCKLSDQNSKVVKKLLWFLSLGRNALLILITTIVAYVMEKNGKAPFVLSGKVRSGLPALSLPPFSAQVGNQTYSFMDMCSQLGSGIIVLPLVAVLANVSIAKAFASGKTIDASQEMRALGLCNIFGGFVSSMPTCGAFTRSAVSNASGVQTPLSGIYSGIMTFLALSFLTPYFYYIPKASLAAVLISAVIFMIDWSIITVLWKGSKKDMLATIGTFAACIYSVQYGLLFGIVLNIFYLLHAWARPSIHVTKCKTPDGDEYILIKPDIGLYYPAVDFLRAKINDAANKEARNILPLVLDCESIKGIDYTAVKGIDAMLNDFEKKGQQLLLLHLDVNILKVIHSFGIIKNFKHVDDSEDIARNLFGDGIELTRCATAPIMKEVENDGKAEEYNPVCLTTEKDSTIDSKEVQERESLLNEYKAVIKEFETIEKSSNKDGSES